MKIENLYPGAWGSNCYLLQSGTHAAIVDPSANADSILTALASRGLTLDFVLLTHGHFDHIVSIDTLRDKTGVPVCIHEGDLLFPENSQRNGIGVLFHVDRTYRRPDRALRNGEILMLGEEPIRVIHTPGHTAGGACFLCNDELLITGDLLFARDFGRYDLYSGNAETLFDSLRRLRELPQSLPIYPGHGEDAILGEALDNVLFF